MSDRNIVHAYSEEALALAASGFESLNFDEDSRTHRAVRARAQPARTRRRQELAALLITLAIGVSLAVISNVMLIVEALLISAMASVNDAATWGLRTASESPDAPRSFIAFVGCRLLLTLGAALLTWWEPHAKASGMARIKSNLNGADITGYLTRRVLVAKSVAITLVVSASLPLGRDGPLVHLGACIGSLLSTASGALEMRSPRALRAWISMGAAAGMAAAFNAPFGGLLYAFEEVASHWSSFLTWRSFLCVLAFAVSTRVLMEAPRTLCEDAEPSVGCAAIASHAFELGLDESALEMRLRDGSLFFYVVVAALGGALGAIFNLAVNRVNQRRRRWHARFTGALSGWGHFLEVMGLALVTFSVFFWLPAAFECSFNPGSGAHGSSSSSAAAASVSASASAAASASSSATSAHHDGSHHLKYVRYLCPAGEHSTLASLLHVSHHSALQFLYHHSSMGDDGGFEVVPPLVAALVACLLCYFGLAVLLLGVRLPCDSFVPGMIIGALGGRLVGELLHGAALIDGGERGMFALVGSAGVLSGITRMSLTVSIIIVEITHDVRTLPLVMLSQAVASSVASRLAEPLEDSMIHLQGLPYLSEEPPSTFVDLTARDVMSPRVETLFEACTVQEILKLLRTNGHNGFPVVRRADKTLSGFILRRQLLVLLHDRVWEIPREKECSVPLPAPPGGSLGRRRWRGGQPQTRHSSGEASKRGLTWEAFEKRYVGSHSTWLDELQHASLNLSPEDIARTLDLLDFMDPSPPTVFGLAPLPHVYHLFNTMGVRHLTVINRKMHVVGIITRKDTFPELVQKRLEVNAEASRACATAAFAASCPQLAGRKSCRDSLAASTASGGPSNFRALNRWRLAREKVSRNLASGGASSRFSVAVRGAITRLTYVSVLASDREREPLRILSEIVTTSLRNNHDADIGGMIHYDLATNAVLQVIEGDDKAVRRLYSTILADQRHRGCVVLKDQRVSTREHLDFGMSLLSTEASWRAPSDSAAQRPLADLPLAELQGPLAQQEGGAGSCSQRSPQAARGRAASGDRLDELSGGGGGGGGALLRLQYSSTLVAESAEDVREVLTQILHRSLHHNPEAGVGGLLVFHADSRTVSQQMEGSEAAVRDLWTRIRADTRHTNVTLTSETRLGEGAARRYCIGSWSMLQMRNKCELDDLSSLASRLRPFGSSDQSAHAAARLATKRIADAAALNDLIERENRGSSAEGPVALSRGNSWFSRGPRRFSGTLSSSQRPSFARVQPIVIQGEDGTHSSGDERSMERDPCATSLTDG